MASLQDRLSVLLTGGAFSDMRNEREADGIIRQIVLVVAYAIVALLILSLGIRALRNGSAAQGLFRVFVGSAILAVLLLRRMEIIPATGGIMATVIFGVFCGITLFARDGDFSLPWICVYPLVSVFTLGLPLGLIPALALFGAVLAGSFVPGLRAPGYSFSEAVRLGGVYLSVTGLTALYEAARSIKDRWLLRHDCYMNMVFGASPTIIMALDEKGCFVYCADAFLRRTRIKSFDDIRKRSFKEVFPRFASPYRPPIVLISSYRSPIGF